MLAKDPAERPQTPAEVAQALAPVHHTVLELDETILAAPSPRYESSPAYKPGFLKKPGLRLAYLAASIILLCALSGGIGLAVWAVLKSGIYSPQDTTAVTQPTDGGTTNDSAGNGGTARVAAVSPGVETPRIEHRAALDPKPPVRVERPTVAVPAEPRNNDVREQALAWIKGNARSGPDCNFVADIEHHLDVTGKENEFLFQIGGGLLKSGRPTILGSWSGQLFTFQLADEQARTLKLTGLAVTAITRIENKNQRTPRLIVKLETALVDNPMSIGESGRITGLIAFKTLEEVSGNFVMRTRGNTGTIRRTSYDHNLGQSLPADGKPIAFDFPAVNYGGGSYTGPIVLFLELCSYPGPDRRGEPTVISNPVAIIIDAVADDGK